MINQENSHIEEVEKMKAEKEKNFFFKAGWILTGLVLAVSIAFHFWHTPLEANPSGCMFFRVLHLYCPGCGGTRSVMALLNGRPLKSLYYHPVVLYTVILFVLYMLTNTIERLSKEKWKIGMHYHNWFAYVALIIIVVNCIFRNIMLVVYHLAI